MVSVLIHEWVTGGGLAGCPLPGSWAAEGAAMRRAIAREFASLPDVHAIVTLDERWAPEQGPWTTVRVGAGEESDVFAALARRADYTLVIAPETGGILADRARILERFSCRSLGATAEAVTLAGDKLRMSRFLAGRGIATPVSCVVSTASLPSDHPYPAVLKPVDGAGSLDTFLIPSPRDVPDAARAASTALLQPYVRGVPLSASFLAHSEGPPRLIGVGRQNVVVRDGRFCYEGGKLPAPREWLVSDVAHAVASVAGLRGFVGVDFVYDDEARKGTVIEINPRPTTSIVGLLRLLPPGNLARAWRDGIGELDVLVHSQAPVAFAPDGTLRDEEGPFTT